MTNNHHGPNKDEAECRDRCNHNKYCFWHYIVEDVDSEELKKPTLHVDMPIWADALDFLTELDKCLDEIYSGGKLFPDGGWHDTCRGWKKNYPVVQKKHYERCMENGMEYANVYALIKELSRRLSPGQITVVVAGGFSVRPYLLRPSFSCCCEPLRTDFFTVG